MRRFQARLHEVAIAALLAPAISLVGARLAVWLVGAAGLARLIPVGVHTYVPAAEVVPLNVLAIISAVGASGALVLALRTCIYGPRRLAGSTESLPKQLIQLVVLAAVAQLLLFAGQLLVVNGTQGVADGATALLFAGAIQAMVSALLAVGRLLLGRLPELHLVPVRLSIAPLALAVLAIPPAVISDRRQFLRHPRRGPPLLPVSLTA